MLSKMYRFEDGRNVSLTWQSMSCSSISMSSFWGWRAELRVARVLSSQWSSSSASLWYRCSACSCRCSSSCSLSFSYRGQPCWIPRWGLEHITKKKFKHRQEYFLVSTSKSCRFPDAFMRIVAILSPSTVRVERSAIWSPAFSSPSLSASSSEKQACSSPISSCSIRISSIRACADGDREMWESDGIELKGMKTVRKQGENCPIAAQTETVCCSCDVGIAMKNGAMQSVQPSAISVPLIWFHTSDLFCFFTTSTIISALYFAFQDFS